MTEPASRASRTSASDPTRALDDGVASTTMVVDTGDGAPQGTSSTSALVISRLTHGVWLFSESPVIHEHVGKHRHAGRTGIPNCHRSAHLNLASTRMAY